jgi:hypothetical protein
MGKGPPQGTDLKQPGPRAIFNTVAKRNKLSLVGIDTQCGIPRATRINASIPKVLFITSRFF